LSEAQKRRSEQFLFDIYVAILKIEDILKDFHNISELAADYRAWDSLIRELEIIGEAVKHLIRLGRIDPKYRVIVDFRNVLSHAYFGIDDEEVWGVATEHLPLFKTSIVELLESMENGRRRELVELLVEESANFDFIVEGLQKLLKE
jgi:uncharacterized protein with HEPN domain